ncbi:putative HipA domain protein [Candidatus Terasakiella magnetica]|uniref:Putative HipA domain protein n=1 Tax=Candidatus Terasakiella magnetica TaxID=1867952 RepID=A0A1C3RE28_9PROT|nr:type II toxin-antitoxin system HipA family toxin [Candidatus Terasakiella magnetica]SCA55543.1 putative HipA domain protein [Candidatus Terasakiella magnetica]
MSLATLNLWGATIGALSWDKKNKTCHFEFSDEFLEYGIELSPFLLPCKQKHYPHLPALLQEALPGPFAQQLLSCWQQQGQKARHTFNPIEQLSILGPRLMGALEVSSTFTSPLKKTAPLDIARLVDLAKELAEGPDDLPAFFNSASSIQSNLFDTALPTKGKSPKVTIAWNEETCEVRSGHGPSEDGYSYWLLKLDGVSERTTASHETNLIEYAYHQMAELAGIDTAASEILEEGERCHFALKRIDRTDTGQKLHMQSHLALKGSAHSQSYEQVAQTIRELGLGMDEIEELLRRAAFNILSANTNDHPCHLMFTMNRKAQWSLAPAINLTFNSNGLAHQMTLNGKSAQFTREDFTAFEKHVSMRRGRAGQIVDEVLQAIKSWPEIASHEDISPATIEHIATQHWEI